MSCGILMSEASDLDNTLYFSQKAHAQVTRGNTFKGKEAKSESDHRPGRHNVLLVKTGVAK